MSDNRLPLFASTLIRDVRFVVALAILATTVPWPAFATTTGIDTPSGINSLPLAVEGVVGATLVNQNGTTPADGPVYVGIGIASPTTPLQIRSATDEDLVFRGPVSASTGAEIGSVNDANSTWQPLQLDGSVTIVGMEGSVGIGTTTPNYPLDVRVAANQHIQISANTAGTYTGAAGIVSLNDAGTGWDPIGFYASGFAFQGGNVGIGLTNPGQALEVYGASNNWDINANYGNPNNPQYGLLAQGSVWAGYFQGPVNIATGYLQFPDGTKQTTAGFSSCTQVASGYGYGVGTYVYASCSAGYTAVGGGCNSVCEPLQSSFLSGNTQVCELFNMQPVMGMCSSNASQSTVQATVTCCK